jgi:hypothetical protein
MEWSDLLIKIGVGACLGFGIIVLAKLLKKKNEPDQKASNPNAAIKQGTKTKGSADTKRNEE